MEISTRTAVISRKGKDHVPRMFTEETVIILKVSSAVLCCKLCCLTIHDYLQAIDYTC